MNTKYALKVIDYILENELEDFAENPSDSHVYYYAVAAVNGLDEADALLAETIKELEEALE